MTRACAVTIEKLLKFIRNNQGVSSPELIDKLGLENTQTKGSGKSCLYRIHKAVERTGQVFWQKDGIKLRWFTTDYALENDIPDRTQESDIRHRSNKKYTPETQDILNRYNWINRLMAHRSAG